MQKGYTLLELMVVISLIGILLYITVPRFHEALFSDDVKKTSRWLIFKVRSLKEDAYQQNTDMNLHIDIDSGKFWISDETMDDEKIQQAYEESMDLPEDLRVLDVEYPEGEKISVGEAIIRFYKKGYSDKAIIHIENEDQRFSYVIEPFLNQIKIHDEYVEFEQ